MTILTNRYSDKRSCLGHICNYSCRIALSTMLLMMGYASDVCGVTISMLVNPDVNSISSGGNKLNGVYSHGQTNYLNITNFMSAQTGTSASGPSIGTHIFKDVKFVGNCYLNIPPQNVLTTKYPYRIVLGYDWTGANALAKYGPGEITFNLIDSNIEGAGGKWKVNGIGLKAVHLREESGVYNNVNKECAITVNGHKITLEKTQADQYLSIDFPEDEKWMDSINLSVAADAAVGIWKIVLYLEDVEGFNTTEDEASRLQMKDGGVYDIPYAKVGSLDFTAYMSARLLDSNGEAIDNYVCEGDSQACMMKLSPKDSGGHLDAGRYYVCYHVNDTNIESRIADSVPFEILPTADGVAFNWGTVKHLGGNTYECIVPESIDYEYENGATLKKDWTNVMITGHNKGTSIYWKLLTDEEIEALRIELTANKTKNKVVKRNESVIPTDYQLYTNGIDLSGGNPDKKDGAVNLILSRNGVTSDPITVLYRQGAPITTGIIETDCLPVSESFYTLTGTRIDNLVSSPERIVIRITTYSDGSRETIKLIRK